MADRAWKADPSDGADAGAVNPYQSPSETFAEVDLLAPTEVRFYLDKRRLHRHAEDQYLLHWHPNRLLLSSLVMIAISVGVLSGALIFRLSFFVPTMLAVMAISAIVYSLLVYRTKRKLRVRQREFGLAGPEMMTLYCDTDQIRLLTPGQSFTWPNGDLRIYRTKRGLLICPEDLLYIFVPKKSLFQLPSYRQFVKAMDLRAGKGIKTTLPSSV